MIPKIQHQDTLNPVYRSFAQELASCGFKGDIHTDYPNRLLNATDNSIYQILPQLVLSPLNHEDVGIILRLANKKPYQTIVFSPRGGGTSTAGQPLSNGCVLDFSKHMNHILSENAEEHWIEVQAGVVRDQMNDALSPHNTFFPPTLSPTNRATIGGMINTDACGKGSVLYGRTSDHIISLKGFLIDSTEVSTEDPSTLAFHADLTQQLAQDYEIIVKEFPKQSRTITGYNLPKSYNAQTKKINLNYLLAGSEGTLFFVTSAKFKTTPLPKHVALVVISYRDFASALDSLSVLRNFKPSSIETMDDEVIKLVKSDFSAEEFEEHLPLTGSDTVSVNYVELSEDDPKNLQEITKKLVESYCKQDKNVLNQAVITDPSVIADLWVVRRKAVGLLGKNPGKRKPIPFIEDTIVPPENLSNYAQELKQFLNEHKVAYGMFGHVDIGCLHIRPALLLQEDNDKQLMGEIYQHVLGLLQKYHGFMWAEHGQGLRSSYNKDLFSPKVLQRFREIKTLFDPHNRLNPGKIAQPLSSKEPLLSFFSPMRGDLDREVSSPLQQAFPKAMECNGNGECFNYRYTDLMCPSYKVTRDRIHSPKGRASLVREWLRLLSKKPYSERKSFRLRKPNREDFSKDVFDAMQGCLACKGCVSQCPINVNIPHLKAKFLHYYHTRYRRSLREMLISRSEKTTPLMTRFPNISNRLMGNFLSKWMMKHLLKLTSLPKSPTPALKKVLRAFPTVSLKQAVSQQTIALFLDMTAYYDPPVVQATIELVQKMGYRIHIAQYSPVGLALYENGYIDAFMKTASQQKKILEQIEKKKIPIVSIEPSFSLCFRDEYVQNGISIPKVLLLEEWLISQKKQLQASLSRSDASYTLFMHCHEHSLVPEAKENWIGVFDCLGMHVQIPDTGCCGMAGIYGHQKEHEANAKKLFEMSWKSQIYQVPKEQVLATGFSCRDQTEKIVSFRPKHPVQILSNL